MKAVPFKDIPQGTDFLGYYSEGSNKNELIKFIKTPNMRQGGLKDGFSSNAIMLEVHRGLIVRFDQYEFCMVEDDVVTYNLEEMIDKIKNIAKGYTKDYSPYPQDDNTEYTLKCSLDALVDKLKAKNSVLNSKLEIKVKQALDRNDTNIPLLLQKICRKH